MKKVWCAALLLCLCGGMSAALSQAKGPTLRLLSPGGRVRVLFSLNETGAPTYSVMYDGRVIVSPSSLGLVLKGGELLSRGMTMKGGRWVSHDEKYELVAGKTRWARDRYNELTVPLQEQGGAGRRLQLIFRAYDDGVAFRYMVPAQDGLKELEIRDERSEFRFPGDYECWALQLRTFHSNYEKEFDRIRLSTIKPDAHTGLPLTIQVPQGPTLAIAEANLKDYAGMYLQGADENAGGVGNAQQSRQQGNARAPGIALVSRLSPSSAGEEVSVRASLPLRSPWRVLMIGDEPGRLIESTLILNLNEPNALADSSWVKPGKAAWDWWSGQLADGVAFKPGMNNETIKHYIDFASEFGLEYMLIDAGWYTARAYGDDADTRADITKSIPEIDLPALVAYGRERHVGLILWLHWIPARDQMDAAFPFYERLGIKGVKVDFMDHDDQAMVGFYHRILRTAAQHHLLVDLHGAYKPTGLVRTYPNYLTQEGVLGAEYNKWSARITPTHNVTLPFTRMLVGPMDYTPGGFRNVTREQFKPQDKGPLVMTTRAQQLAMYVVYESPLQMVADYPEAYRGQPGSDFLRQVPSSWDETRVLEGKIGEIIAVARRRGSDWFIGVMNGEGARTLQLPLRFLESGAYELQEFADGPEAATAPTQLHISTRRIRASDSLTVRVVSGGGYAAHLRPAR